MFNFEQNSAFSTELPMLQLAWDSTSLGAFKECARKYQYSILFGYAPRLESVHLTFGLLYHAALERYDHARFAGASHDDALDVAVDFTLKATWTKGRPWSSDDPNKNRLTLIRTVVWYLDQFQEDPIETARLENGRPAVELSFQFQTGHTAMQTGEPYLLAGHMDRIGIFQGHHYILDRKTTKNTISTDFFKKFSPDNQFSTYMLAGKIVWKFPLAGLVVDAAQVAVTFSRFERAPIERKQDQIDEWYEDLGHWLQLAGHYARHNYWPQNDKSCGNYGGCPFRDICGQSPKTRPEWLQRGYVHRAWNPLIARGDI